jgi:hypothetical protein
MPNTAAFARVCELSGRCSKLNDKDDLTVSFSPRLFE